MEGSDGYSCSLEERSLSKEQSFIGSIDPVDFDPPGLFAFNAIFKQAFFWPIQYHLHNCYGSDCLSVVELASYSDTVHLASYHSLALASA